MSKDGDLIFELIKIWAEEQELYSKQGTIKSIDLNTRTCVVTPTDGGPDILDVNLEADSETSTSKGFYVVPAVDSLVIITFTSKEEAFISAWTEIDQVVSKQAEWIFNDGDNGGLTITPELKTQLDKLTKRVDDVIDAIKNGVPVAQDGGAALQATQTILLDLIVDKEDFSGIENEFVKH